MTEWADTVTGFDERLLDGALARAIRAPSIHNSQPWCWQVGPRGVDLYTDAARDQIGQVAVPFGICTEPSNVTAGGHSCGRRRALRYARLTADLNGASIAAPALQTPPDIATTGASLGP